MTFISNIMAGFGMCFQEPTLALFLKEKFNIGENYSGIIMGTGCITYMIMGLIIGYMI